MKAISTLIQEREDLLARHTTLVAQGATIAACINEATARHAEAEAELQALESTQSQERLQELLRGNRVQLASDRTVTLRSGIDQAKGDIALLEAERAKVERETVAAARAVEVATITILVRVEAVLLERYHRAAAVFIRGAVLPLRRIADYLDTANRMERGTYLAERAVRANIVVGVTRIAAAGARRPVLPFEPEIWFNGLGIVPEQTTTLPLDLHDAARQTFLPDAVLDAARSGAFDED